MPGHLLLDEGQTRQAGPDPDQQRVSSVLPALRSEWGTLIGPDTSRHCALIGWDHGVATPAVLCHKDTAQSPLLGEFLTFRCFFMA